MVRLLTLPSTTCKQNGTSLFLYKIKLNYFLSLLFLGPPAPMALQDMVMQASGGVLNHGNLLPEGNEGCQSTAVVSSKEDGYNNSESGCQATTYDDESLNSEQLEPTILLEEQVPTSAVG